MPSATIITAFYNLYNSQEKIEHYLELGKLWSNVSAPMVIFTEESLVGSIKELRQEYADSTTIVVQEMPYESSREMIQEALDKSPIPNRSPEKDTIDYFVYNVSKFDWIRQAVGMNPYKSTHFAWLDFGLDKFECITPESIHAIVNQKVPDRIRVMMISCPPMEWLDEPSKAKYCFNSIRHHHAGGVITGSSEYLLRFSVWADGYHHKMLNEGWYQLDEVFISMAHQEHSTAFDVYYGDYQSIGSYHQPGNCWGVIMALGKQLLRYKWYDQLEHWRQFIQYTVPPNHLGLLLEITIMYYYYYAVPRGIPKQLPRFISACLSHPNSKEIRERHEDDLKFYQ